MELTSLLYIKVILAELWRLMDENQTMAPLKNQIKTKTNDPVERYTAFKSVLSSKRYKDTTDAFIGSSWERIYPLVMNERELTELFNGAGFTQQFIASEMMPDDAQVKNIPDAKVAKMQIKDHIAQWMKSYKDALITTIFTPER